jgi:(+)-trans-carveol dehydrogenase
MAGRVAGKVAFITGAARGQGDTVKEVEALDRRIVATQADVRDYGAVKAAQDDGVAQLGKLDIVSANAGIFSFGTMKELDETHWQDMIDVNLTSVWHAAKAAIGHLRAAGGGSMILTSSMAGLQATGGRGWTCCSTPRASRTRSWPGTWPGWAAGGCSASGPTPTWHPR